MTPAARVLAALGAAPEGLTTDQIWAALCNDGQAVTIHDLMCALIDLTATGGVRVLPLGPKGGPVKSLFLLPSDDALRRDRESRGGRR